MRKIYGWIGLLLLSGIPGNGFVQVVVRPEALQKLTWYQDIYHLGN